MRFNIDAVVALLLLYITSTTFALPTDNQLITREQAEVLDARSNENGLFADIKNIWKRKGGGGGGGKGGGSSSSGSGSSSSGSSSSGSSSSSSSSGKSGYVGSSSPSSSSGSEVSSGGGSSQGLSSGSTSERSSWSSMSSGGRDSSSSSTPGESWWNSNGARGVGGSTSYGSSSSASKQGYVRRSSPPNGSTSGKSWWEREKEKWRKAAEMPKEYRGKSAADILGGDKFCNGPCMTMACIIYCSPEQRHRTDKRSRPPLRNAVKTMEYANRTWSPSYRPDPEELGIHLKYLHGRVLPAPPSTATPKKEFEIPPPGNRWYKSPGTKVRRSENSSDFSWEGNFYLPVGAAGPLVSRSPPKEGDENFHGWEWLKDASKSDLDRLDGIEKLPRKKQYLVTRLGISAGGHGISSGGGGHGSSSGGNSGSSGGHAGSGPSSSSSSNSGSHGSGSESSSSYTGSNSEHSSSSSSAGKGSSSSNTGGSTKTGSGVAPAYGGGRYYGGGATTPYAAGSRSPLGIAAVPLALGVAALAVYPGLWIYGAYAYPYSHPYTFYNRTASANSTNSTNTRRDILDEYPTLLIRQSEDTGVNETKPVTCLCAMYAECGCDDNGNTTFLDSIIGDGTYSNLNLSLVNVADINGTSTIVLNGTLPNGTTASGGTDNANAAAKSVVEGAGYWVMVAIVGATVYMV